MGILISQYRLQPLHITVGKIMSHSAVAVYVNQPGQHQQAFGIHFRLIRHLVSAFHNLPVLNI